jgi:hypothetical protein
MARTHSPSLLGCSRSSEWKRQLKRGRGVIFIGLATEASHWKRFPEKVVPSDEPMVSPCAGVGSSGHSTGSNITVEPSNPVNTPMLYTDAPSDHPVLKSTHSGQYYMF